MTPEALTLEQGLELLRIPRVVGEHPGGGEITAHNGRYGPYVKWGKETRSLDAEEDLLTVTLDEAVARAGPAEAAPPHRRLAPRNWDRRPTARPSTCATAASVPT